MKKILSVELRSHTLVALVMLCASAYSAMNGAVGHNGKYFHVTESDRSFKVGRESLDSTLKNVNKSNLARFMKVGRVSSHKTNDGSYVLR